MRPKRTRICFDLDPKDEQGYRVENLWAEPVGQHTFRILNSPFFVFGISAEDIVKASPEGGRYRFDAVMSRGGHSTYRLYLQGKHTVHDSVFRRMWRRIASHGCTFENANDRLLAIDIPPGSDVQAVYELLKEGQRESVWAFEEGHYSGAGGPGEREP